MKDTKMIEEKCENCLHYRACILNSEYVPTLCRIYEDRTNYRKEREGEWTWEHDLIRDPKRYFIRVVCSCCGLKTGETSNYCPKCGAKMKGGE